MKQPYKVQNRTSDPNRVKLTKNGGIISFPNGPTTSFIENIREAGFCLSPLAPLPLRDGPTWSISLTAHPMGTDGRVSLFINNILIESKRYSNLSRVSDRQAWFNVEFGAYAQYSGRETATFISIGDSPDVYRFVFEDDDLDYFLSNVSNTLGDLNPTLIVEQYRLAFDIKKEDTVFKLICSSSIVTSPMIIMGDGLYDISINDTPINTNSLTLDSAITELSSNGVLTTVTDIGEPFVLSTTVTDITTNIPKITFWNTAAPEIEKVYVDWGEGGFEEYLVQTYGNSVEMTHTYSSAGDYTIKVYYPDTYVNSFEIDGVQNLVDWSGENRNTQFYLLSVETVPTYIPTTMTDISYMFSGNTVFNQDISMWDVSNVTNMDFMFSGAIAFNGDVSTWNVRNVTSMASMFADAVSFNGNIGGWAPYSVTDFYRFLFNSQTFDQDLSQWCVPLISAEPDSFATNSSLIEAHKPVWGTCPRGENLV